MPKIDRFLHRYHLFRCAQWRWVGGERDLQPFPQGEKAVQPTTAVETAPIAGCVIPGNACGHKTSRIRTVRGGGPKSQG